MKAPKLTAFGYVKAVLMTGIFGSQTIVKDFVPNLRIVPISTTLKTMSFDCTGDAAKQAVEQARVSVAGFLKSERLHARLTSLALSDILDFAESAIAQRRNTRKRPRLRAVLIDPICRSSEKDVIGFRVVMAKNGRRCR